MEQIIIWDTIYNVPRIVIKNINEKQKKEMGYITTDVRPVFLQEKYLLFCLFPELEEKVMISSVWNASNNHYYINGKKLKDSIYKRFLECDLIQLKEKVLSYIPTQKQQEFETKNFKDFVEQNKNHFYNIVNDSSKDSDGFSLGARPFVREAISKYPHRVPVVSFSGGKDSTVISHLVRSALGQNEVLHVNADTTIEFPTTYKYMSEFKSLNSEVPFFIESVGDEAGVNDFFELSKKIGPPSRVKSWCCSIFKTGPMGDAFANMNENWLTFYGVRRSESAARKKYDKISQSPKIEKQIVVSPIIDWKDVDIWLYLLTENIEFNEAYRQGFSRVGCWCCPNNSQWSDILMAIFNHEHYMKWHTFLIDFAKQIGKKDYNEYVATGMWKARQGGTGLDNMLTHRSVVKYTQITNKQRDYNLRKKVQFEKLLEFFKPFGKLERSIGVKSNSEAIIVDRFNNEIMRITNCAKDIVKVELIADDLEQIYKKNGINTHIWSYIDKQIRKYQVCINCQACIAACPFGALKVDSKSYTIDENKCVHCLKCIGHFPKGCLIASALTIRKSEEK